MASKFKPETLRLVPQSWLSFNLEEHHLKPRHQTGNSATRNMKRQDTHLYQSIFTFSKAYSRVVTTLCPDTTDTREI